MCLKPHQDSLLEQIRQLNKVNETLRRDLVEREEWKISDLAHAKKTEDMAKDEMAKMRSVLEESSTENKNLSKSIVRAQAEKEKSERQLKTRIGDLEELLHHRSLLYNCSIHL